MRSRTANVESLEARQFFSVTPVTGLAERATAAVAPAAVVQTLKKTKAPPSSITCSLSKSGWLSVAGTGGRDQIHVVQSGKYINVCREGKKGRLVGVFAVRTAKVQYVSVNANAGHDYVNCKDVFRPCVITGGDGNDFIHGSDYVDHIEGNGGNDEIHGHEDGDVIEGGDGNDTLVGQDGNDYLVGGAGLDNMMGGSGDDEIMSHDGQWKDYISGGPGDDVATADKNHEYDYQGEWQEGYWEKSWMSAADIESIHG
jgi:hypothetical protein